MGSEGEGLHGSNMEVGSALEDLHAFHSFKCQVLSGDSSSGWVFNANISSGEEMFLCSRCSDHGTLWSCRTQKIVATAAPAGVCWMFLTLVNAHVQ